MARRKNEPVKVMVKGKEKSVKGKKAFPENLLDAFERIVGKAEHSELNDDFFIEAGLDIRYVTDLLNITPFQAVFLSIFMDKSEDSRIRPSEIASFIGVKTIRMLKYLDEIEGLVKKKYIKSSKRRDDTTFSVPQYVIKALRQNKPFEYVEEPVTNTQEFFDRFKSISKEKDNDEIDYNYFMERTMEMFNGIKDTSFHRSLQRLNIENNLLMLFFYMSHLYVNNDDEDIRFSDIENLYDDEEIPGWIKRDLKNHDNELFELELIENVNEDGIAQPGSFKLTDKAKQEILGEVDVNSIGKSREGLVKHENLVEKKLIYNKTEQEQIRELSSILSEKRFKEVQCRLKESGMRQGFCCIFYGSPGTGKTETVFQLARQTGRDILQVDVDKVKSCWVGESEKNIKSLFDRYRNICKNSELAPILLFNEADAVLGTRMEGASRAVDKMENSIQNIILQEMEKLEGIMIATTNLTSNLDKAFERRFLYKVKFEKPTIEARAEIWRSMLKGLKKKDALFLASKFDLSGGEIENVTRRHTVQSILSGSSRIDIKALEESCKLERLSKPTSVRVGF